MIQLLCPNAKCGEKLSCPDNFAGKLGKCPHCGSKFKVPIPKKATAAAAIHDATEVDDSDILEEDAMERIVDSDILDRGGEAEELVDSDILEPHPERTPSRPLQKPPVQHRPVLSIDALVDDEDQPPALMPPGRSGKRGAAPPLPPSEMVAPVHPLSVLFGQLWEQKQKGANLELQLADGEKVAPEGYAPALSQFTHGVFAVKMLDGTHTMTAVAWDKVARITLRGVRDLPPGLFG